MGQNIPTPFNLSLNQDKSRLFIVCIQHIIAITCVKYFIHTLFYAF